MDDLGAALLEAVDDGERDVVLSPLGLRRALEAVRRGATGPTRAALDGLLGPEAPPPVDIDDPAIVLYAATGAWLADGYSPGPALNGLAAGRLDVAAVNAWAHEQTRGMIPSIVDRLSADEQLVITDAVYLDAAWLDPFDLELTRPHAFAGAGEVAMMDAAGEFDYAEDDGLRAVRLPYGNEGALRFIAVLGDGDWRRLRFRHRRGRVQLPRFSAESQLRLAEPLAALGLAPAFVPGWDLEGLFTGAGAKALSRIMQRARADVDEKGTKAAAVTAVMAIAVSAVREAPPPFHIVFDRPFTWAVEHAPTGTLLFVGRVRHPTERSD